MTAPADGPSGTWNGTGTAPAGSRLAPGSRRVVLALGSNLGDRLASLQAGLGILAAAPGLGQLSVSPVYETAPVGGPVQDDYLNAVVIAETALPARAILDRARQAEAALGRVRTQRWGPRTLDVDIIACGAEISADPELTLPHPRAHERAFVLAPWHDLDPAAQLPGRGPIADLLAEIGGTGIRRVPEVSLRVPEASRPAPAAGAGAGAPEAGLRAPEAGLRAPEAGQRAPEAGNQMPEAGLRPAPGRES